MKLSDTIALELSKNRVRLAELAGMQDIAGDDLIELQTRQADMANLEFRHQAAITSEAAEVETAKAEAEQAPDRLTLQQRAMTDGGWVDAALDHRDLQGAAAEFTQEVTGGETRGPGGGVFLPWEMAELALETRADAMTTVTTTAPGPDTYVRPILGRIWAGNMDSAMLGVMPQSFPAGTATFSVISAGPTGAVIAEADIDGTPPDAQSLTLVSTELSGLLAHCSINLTAHAQARHGADLESLARRDLMSALMDQMENRIFGSNGFAGITAAPASPSAVVDWATAIDMLDSQVDGLYAKSARDVTLCVGPATYQKLNTLLASGTARSALSELEARARNVFVSSKIAAPSSNVQAAISYRGNQAGTTLFPLWNSVEVGSDRGVTSGGTSQRLYANVMYNFSVRNAANTRQAYARPNLKLA